MAENIINNTFRPTKNDAIVMCCIKLLDARCENDASACRYAFSNAEEDENFDFKKAASYKPRNINKIDADSVKYASSKSYSLKEDVWKGVLNKFKTQLGVDKVRISYLTRLVLNGYLMRLEMDAVPEKEVKVKTETIDGVELLQKVNNRAAELIKAGEIDTVLAFIGEEV